MEKKIEIIGIVKPGIDRTTKEWGAKECAFDLECSFTEKVYCPSFIPNIRKGYKIKVIGTKRDDALFIYADSVELIKDEPLEQKGTQLKLGVFIK